MDSLIENRNKPLTTDKFWVIVVISNPVRYKSRYELYQKFISKMKGINVLTVECAFGDRPFEVTEVGHPYHVQVRTFDEYWHKENLINIGLSRLPSDWEYVAWIDADVEFVRPDWAMETVHQLQHYMVVQMFQNAIDLGPTGEMIQSHQGFMWAYLTGKPQGKGYTHWHPGYAWAARREAIDYLGGLYDVSFGSGDHLMAWALLGQGVEQLPESMSAGYKESLADWQRRALQYLHLDVGFVPGTLIHNWHGKKRDRRYKDRWLILSENQFDPYTDLKKDWQGLWQIDMDGSQRLIRLRDEIRAYFRSRNEDSIDVV